MPSSAGSETRSEATSVDPTNSDDESSDAALASLADHSEGDLDEDEAADSLPGYLLRSIARLELLSLSDVEEETNEVGDGGDSDVEGDDLEEHDEAMTTAIAERLATAADDDGNEIIDDGDRNSFLLKKGSHPDLNIPSIPENWVPATQKVEKGEPTFDEIDNPGQWCNFTFRPEFGANGGAYTKHTLPTGATPVPEVDGKRCRGPWEFHYQGYKSEGSFRDGSTRDNLFPSTRKGQLDAELLKTMGLTKERMTTGDALFFHQLLLPICDPKRSGIKEDNRKPFYSEVERLSNIYAFSIGLGGSYGHAFKTITLDELVRFDGVVVRDGVRGGSNGALYRRWMENCADHDDEIDQSMRHGRWLQIKRVVKLCNNQAAPKRGMEGYDPAYKYDMLWYVLFANVNAISKHAELDLCGDETTWGHGGFGEAGSGLVGRIMGKPGISKGGQIVMISDVNRIRPRAYVHRHKLHTKPPGWTTQGPSEVRKIMEMITPMVEGQEAGYGGQRQIYRQKPHSTWDNFFSGDIICSWMGENGFGCTMTCRRDRLPKDIPAENFHKKKTSSDSRPKVARFHQPICAVKTVMPEGDKEGYERVHVSFQSTSSCNLSTVNALNECSMFIRKKERGRGASKRKWGIEMNDARMMYLQSYYRIDTIDHLISNCNMFYRSWKYWHSPMIHGKALAVVVAYDMYLECAEGDLDPAWKIEKPIDFWSFREKLSEQMLQYKPTRRKYPGDGNMRAATQQSQRDRKEKTKERNDQSILDMTQGDPEVDANNPIDRAILKRAVGRRGKSRLCGNLSHFERHVESVQTGKKHPLSCRVCGEQCYSVCGLCNKPLHFFPNRGKNMGKSCFLEYHNDSFFGLAVEDCKVMQKRKSDWTPPSATKKKVQKRHIDSLMGSSA